MKDAGDWKQSWFKEIRSWRKFDAKCYGAAWLSIYGIPCFVRNKKFCEALLSDVGFMANTQSLEDKPLRLDVTKLMIFTNNIEPINRMINVCVDDAWEKVLIVEDASVCIHKDDGIRSEKYFSFEESDDGGDTPEYASGGEETPERENYTTV